MPGLQMDWMARRDVPEVLRIERECFEFPWNEAELIRCLRQASCLGKVARLENRVVGMLVIMLEKRQRQFTLLNFAVDPQFQRRGIGAWMLQYYKQKLDAGHRTKIVVNVRESNLPALLFFRAQQFRAVKLTRNFYEHTPDDAITMRYDLNPPAWAAPTNRIQRHFKVC